MSNNSAGRIHAILKNAAQYFPQMQTVQAWGKGLGVEGTLSAVSPLLLSMLTQLDDIECEIRVRFTPYQANIKLKYFPQLRKIIAFDHINGSGQQIVPQLTNDVLYCIESLSADLEDEPTISKPDLDTVKKELDELFELVLKSDLKPKLKTWILSWLAKIQSAISHFKIYGTKGLQEALIAIQGEVAFLSPALKKVAEESPTIFEQLEKVYGRVEKLANFSERLQRLCESPVAVQAITLGINYLTGP